MFFPCFIVWCVGGHVDVRHVIHSPSPVRFTVNTGLCVLDTFRAGTPIQSPLASHGGGFRQLGRLDLDSPLVEYLFPFLIRIQQDGCFFQGTRPPKNNQWLSFPSTRLSGLAKRSSDFMFATTVQTQGLRQGTLEGSERPERAVPSKTTRPTSNFFWPINPLWK